MLWVVLAEILGVAVSNEQTAGRSIEFDYSNQLLDCATLECRSPAAKKFFPILRFLGVLFAIGVLAGGSFIILAPDWQLPTTGKVIVVGVCLLAAFAIIAITFYPQVALFGLPHYQVGTHALASNANEICDTYKGVTRSIPWSSVVCWEAYKGLILIHISGNTGLVIPADQQNAEQLQAFRDQLATNCKPQDRVRT